MCRFAADYRNAGTLYSIPQRLYNVLGPVTDGKYPAAPFCFQRNAQILKIRHDILGHAPGKGAVQKLAVAGNIGKKRVSVTIVGEIAPSFSGNAELSSDLFILF